MPQVKGKSTGKSRGRPGAARPASAPRAMFLSYLRGEKKKSEAAKRHHLSAMALRGAVLLGLVIMVVWIAGIGDEAGRAANGVVIKTARAVGVNLSDVHAYGLNHTTPQEIADALMMESGESLLRFNPQRTRARLLDLPWVRNAEVRRLLPNRIIISIEERTPFVIYRGDGRSVLVDDVLVEIGPVVASKFPDLLIVEGEGAPEAAKELVTLMRTRPQLRERFIAFRYVEGRRWDGLGRDGLIVQFPESELAVGIQRLERIQTQDRIFEHPLAIIDLRNENVVVRPRTLLEAGRGA